MAKILVVDDDRKTVSTISLYLQHRGHDTVPAHSGPEAIEAFREGSPDLVILDLMLPDLDGVDVAKLLRLESQVPIVMVTARDIEEDRLTGFEAGADDYVVKPFSPRELVARVEAVLRRSGRMDESPIIQLPGLLVDTRRHLVAVDGMEVRLTPTEFRIIETLARQPGRVFSRADIVAQVFGGSYPGLDRSVDTHLSNLRKKLGSSSRQSLIVTVHGVGYKLPEGSGET